MFQKILFSAGLMLVVFTSWGQETLDIDGVEIKVHGIFSPEKVDRMSIIKPSPGFNSNMEIAALTPVEQAKMPIYNDRPEVREMPRLREYSPTGSYGQDRFGELVPKGEINEALKLLEPGAFVFDPKKENGE
ncbi:hypothetical protein KIH41_13250 [Litoribacter ruber]|uniref:hypothetical protein n=1 Tax=Litoribacter ruber TaxID=702568 RepID=UPI001BD986C9|nr:hypothetical protein [Litoribacter ruber]MBT0812246.1 hypothetical protein [Litoribacter ruber]